MATVYKWTPFGVALDISASSTAVRRISAIKYEVDIKVSWETYYSGANTIFGMDATSGGVTKTISSFGKARSSGSATLTGSYSISGNGSATKTVSVTFKNYNTDSKQSATKAVTFDVTVPALASYKVSYNANGGTGAPATQTKWKDQALTLSSTKPTRTGYTFQGWATSSTATTHTYASGASYASNAAVTLYAVWKANTYTVSYNANGGTGAPSAQTKTYGVDLTLSSTKPKKTNYTFKGWATSATSTIVSYAAGGTYKNNAAITLYAVWELSYVKPRITNFSVNRCDSAGNVSDEGTYARVKFNWACDLAVITASVTWKSSVATGKGSKTFAVSGTSGSINEIFGSGNLSTDLTYTITVQVVDSNGNTSKSKSLPAQSALIDAFPEEKGIAFGKVAEKEGYADFQFKTYNRDNSEYVNDKSIFGTSTDGTVYSALIPVTASDNTSLGYGLYKAEKGKTHIYGNEVRFYTNKGIYTNSNKIVMNQGASIYGILNGEEKSMFTPFSDNGNTILGYGGWADKSGNSHIYGYDVMHYVSNIANPGSYRPYRRRGDTMTLTLRTAGYVTNGKTDVTFHVPFTTPIIGTPTISVTSNNGFILRQGDKYTHGSSADTYVTPTSYSAALHTWHGITIIAKFSDTTNVTNNDAIGIYWNGTITFS